LRDTSAASTSSRSTRSSSASAAGAGKTAATMRTPSQMVVIDLSIEPPGKLAIEPQHRTVGGKPRGVEALPTRHWRWRGAPEAAARCLLRPKKQPQTAPFAGWRLAICTLAQMIAQRGAGIIGAKQSAALQLGHDQLDEVVKGTREVRREDHEPVGQLSHE